jgi:hypothetical protein
MASKRVSTGTKTSKRKAPVAAPPAADDPTSDGVDTAPAAAAIDPEVRRQLVAKEAYYLAERRGFSAGGEVEDWVTAEAMVDSRLYEGKVA